MIVPCGLTPESCFLRVQSKMSRSSHSFIMIRKDLGEYLRWGTEKPQSFSLVGTHSRIYEMQRFDTLLLNNNG